MPHSYRTLFGDLILARAAVRVNAQRGNRVGSQSSGEYVAKFGRQPHIRSSGYVWRRSVKLSATATQGRTLDLPPLAKTASS